MDIIVFDKDHVMPYGDLSKGKHIQFFFKESPVGEGDTFPWNFLRPFLDDPLVPSFTRDMPEAVKLAEDLRKRFVAIPQLEFEKVYLHQHMLPISTITSRAFQDGELIVTTVYIEKSQERHLGSLIHCKVPHWNHLPESDPYGKIHFRKEIRCLFIEYLIRNGIDYSSCPIGDRACLLYTSPSPRDRQKSRMPSSA